MCTAGVGEVGLGLSSRTLVGGSGKDLTMDGGWVVFHWRWELPC